MTNKAFYDSLDKIHSRVNSCGLEHVHYSAYLLDKSGVAIDNLNEIACHGKVRFNYCGWLEEGHSEYVSDVLENPTWLDVAKLADEAIRVTGDTHHIYLEGIRIDTSNSEKCNSHVSTYTLIMGS